MNKKQLIVLWIGIGIIAVMGLCPPVQRTRRSIGRRGLSGGSYTYVEYCFILDERGPVALSNLVAQWVIVSVITGGLIVTFKDKKPKND